MSGVSDYRVMSCVSDEKASTRRVAKGTKSAGITHRWAEPRASHRWAGIASLGWHHRWAFHVCSRMGM
jgi:hypothetical protein